MSSQRGSINLTLPKDLDRFVREQTRSGKYASAREVVEEALRLLEAAEGVREKRFRDVKAKIAEGLDSLDRGKGLDGEDALDELLQSVSHPRTKFTL